MIHRALIALAAFATLVFADALTLKTGEVVRGVYIGGDARHVRMAVGDVVQTYSIDDIATLQFGGPRSADNPRDMGVREPPPPQTAAAPPPAAYSTPPPAAASSAPPPASGGLVIPAGTTIVVRMIDAVNSDESRLGQTFRASVDEPLVVDGQTVVQRGSDAVVKLVEDKDSGKIEGRTVLTLVLQQVSTNGRLTDVTTGDVSQASGSRGSKSAKVIGGTAALGAIIGAIAGGGRGAAIGAGSGAAVGTGVQVLTKGQTVKIPSETRLTFTLQQPVQL